VTSAPASAGTVAALRATAHAAVLTELEEVARVRLGAAADTTPDVLRVLAEDPLVTVRAAVAMNPSAPAQADRLLALDADERVRTLLARKLATLLPSLPAADRTTLEGHVFATLAALVKDEAVRVRMAIADVVKEMPQAPRELILRLARDNSLSVSEPVVRLSPLLTAEDLLALLADAQAPGIAAAMAQRRGLPASVSDRIAATADTQAIAALLANRSAAIREATLDALIGRAQAHAEWHEPLAQRPSLSARAARALSEIVATQVLGALVSRGDLDQDVTQDLQRRLTERLAGRQPAAPSAEPSLAAIEARVLAMAADDRLTEAALLEAAQRGESMLCTVMLAAAAGVSIAVVERAAALRSAKAMLSLVWKAGFTMRAASALQVLLCHLAPDSALAGRDGRSFPLAIDEMRWQIEFLQRPGR
jgi:uncharacterized protein (DUF2336 family)